VRHGVNYSDMPDVVQTSTFTANCYDQQDNLYARWLQSNASFDFPGLSYTQLMCALLLWIAK